MRPSLLFLTGLVSIASVAMAAAPACVPGTLSSYIALGAGGCSISSVTFSSFGYAAKASGGAAQIPPDQIQVNPIFGVPSIAGFTFTAKWSVATGQTQDSFIRYTVIGPATSSASLTLNMGAFQVGAVGAVAIREADNVGALLVFANCSQGACRSRTQDTLNFSPASVALQVVDHVKLVSRDGDVSLSSFNATVNYCPLCV